MTDTYKDRKKYTVLIILSIFSFNLYSYEITDESIKIHDEKHNEYSLLMNFDTIKAYLGEPIENIYSKDYEDEIVGYAYDGFYI